MSSFQEMYARIVHLKSLDITPQVVTQRDTLYTIEATEVAGRQTIVCRLPSGRVDIHEDCWGKNETCSGAWASGLYNGSPSLYDWIVKK